MPLANKFIILDNEHYTAKYTLYEIFASLRYDKS
jgi:hypothetical protein